MLVYFTIDHITSFLICDIVFLWHKLSFLNWNRGQLSLCWTIFTRNQKSEMQIICVPRNTFLWYLLDRKWAFLCWDNWQCRLCWTIFYRNMKSIIQIMCVQRILNLCCLIYPTLLYCRIVHKTGVMIFNMVSLLKKIVMFMLI